MVAAELVAGVDMVSVAAAVAVLSRVLVCVGEDVGDGEGLVTDWGASAEVVVPSSVTVMVVGVEPIRTFVAFSPRPPTNVSCASRTVAGVSVF